MAAGALDPPDDAGQHGHQLRVGGNDPFGVGLGGADLQKRHHLPGRGVVLADAEMGQLQQFLDPHAGAPQNLDDGESPERVVLGDVRVESFPWLVEALHKQPDGLDAAAGPDPQVAGAVNGKLPAWRRGAGSLQQRGRGAQLLPGCRDQLREHRDQRTGALGHPCPPAPGLLDVAADVVLADRARGRPLRPAGRVFQ